jgi:hypothetical protein
MQDLSKIPQNKLTAGFSALQLSNASPSRRCATAKAADGF